MRATITALVAGFALGAGAADAWAQTLSDGFTYQGVLTDNGQPASGAYDLEFRIFDAEFDGAQVSPDLTLPNQAVADGLVTQVLEFGPGIFNGNRRWLEVRVRAVGGGAFAVLPRQEIRATPNAVFAKTADVSGFAMTSGTTLQEAFDNGASIDTGGAFLTLENTFDAGRVGVFVSDVVGNDALRLFDGAGVEYLYTSRDVDGDAGFLQVSSPGLNSFRVDGNVQGSGSPGVAIFGSASDIVFDSSLGGGASVSLPVAAISARETGEEAGVAFASDQANTTLTSTLSVVESRSITAPAAGFVVAIATAQVFIDHVTGNDSAVNLALGPNPGSFNGAQQARVEIEASLGTDASISRVVTVHDVFSVPVGTSTFYLNASATGAGDDTDVDDRQLTLLYVPTQYGLVAGAPRADDPTGAVEPGPLASSSPVRSAADLAVERKASTAANVARLEAEVAAMRAEMEAMRAAFGRQSPR